jgi:hypothetical protein
MDVAWKVEKIYPDDPPHSEPSALFPMPGFPVTTTARTGLAYRLRLYNFSTEYGVGMVITDKSA